MRDVAIVGGGLVGLCADLGGSVLIHGSPKQRSIPEGDDPQSWCARTLSPVALGHKIGLRQADHARRESLHHEL